MTSTKQLPAAKREKQPERKSRAPRANYDALFQPSESLAAIVGDHPVTRVEVTRRVWEYIKSHNLQDQRRRTMVNADEVLRKVLGQSRASMFEMMRLVQASLAPLNETTKRVGEVESAASSGARERSRLSAQALNVVTAEHIWEAVELLLEGSTKHSFGPSTDFDLIARDGTRLPPKAAFGIALSLATNTDIQPKHFTAGVASICFRKLREAGYEIVAKGESPSSPDPDLSGESPHGQRETLCSRNTDVVSVRAGYLRRKRPNTCGAMAFYVASYAQSFRLSTTSRNTQRRVLRFITGRPMSAKWPRSTEQLWTISSAFVPTVTESHTACSPLRGTSRPASLLRPIEYFERWY